MFSDDEFGLMRMFSIAIGSARDAVKEKFLRNLNIIMDATLSGEEKAELLKGEYPDDFVEEVGAEMGLLERRIAQRSRREMREEMRNELRDEVRNEVRDEVRNEVRDELRNEVRDDVRNEVRDEVRNEVRDEVRNEVQDEVRKKMEEKDSQIAALKQKIDELRY